MRAVKMDLGCHERFPSSGLSDDHEGLSGGGEVRDSRLEPCDRRAAAYDLEGIQSSGPGVRDQNEVRNVGRKETDGSQMEVSWSRGLWDSEGGLFRRDQIAPRAAIEDYLSLCITWLLSRFLRNVSVLNEGETRK